MNKICFFFFLLNFSTLFAVDERYIDSQKNLLNKNKSIEERYTFEILGLQFVGFPNVFSPKACCEQGFFVEKIPIHQNDTVLEIGSGTGFFPIFAIHKGAQKVIATDINPDAVENTMENAKLHKMETKIEALQSDIFNAIPPDAKFDLIYWNIPFTPTQESNLTLLDLSVFDPDNAFLDRYFKEGKKFLKENGKLYLGYSSTHGDVTKLKEIAKKYDWEIKKIAETGNIATIIVELYECK